MIARRSSRIAAALLMMVGLSVGVAQQAAPAEPDSDSRSRVVCSTSGEDTVIPGLTEETIRFEYVSIGRGAVAKCKGRLHDRDFTGTGFYYEEGPALGSSQGGAGYGTYKLSIKTKAGWRSTEGDFYWYYLDGGNIGQNFGENFDVDFTITPTEGDGVNEPITKILVVQTVVITS